LLAEDVPWSTSASAFSGAKNDRSAHDRPADGDLEGWKEIVDFIEKITGERESVRNAGRIVEAAGVDLKKYKGRVWIPPKDQERLRQHLRQTTR
jgi:hypothetical protein